MHKRGDLSNSRLSSGNSGVDLGRILPLPDLAGDEYKLVALQENRQLSSKFLIVLMLAEQLGVGRGSPAWQEPCINFGLGLLAISWHYCFAQWAKLAKISFGDGQVEAKRPLWFGMVN